MSVPIKNTINREEFLRNGYTVFQFVSESQLAKMKTLFEKYCVAPNHNPGEVYYSMFANSGENSIALKNELKSILRESYERIFENYSSHTEMFIAKRRDERQLLLHQDWSYCDERNEFEATLW